MTDKDELGEGAMAFDENANLGLLGSAKMLQPGNGADGDGDSTMSHAMSPTKVNRLSR